MSREIRIYRDAVTGLVFFKGSNIKPQPANVLEVVNHPTKVNRLKISRTDRFKRDGVTPRVKFSKLNYTRIRDIDGNSFSSRDQARDYLQEAFSQDPTSINADYKGLWNPPSNDPDIFTDLSQFLAGDQFRVINGGTFDGINYRAGDDLVFSGTSWDVHKNNSITVSDIVSSGINKYDLVIDPNYTGDIEDGSSFRPYKDFSVGISNTNPGDVILVKGVNIISSTVTLPHELTIDGVQGSGVGFPTFNESNGDVINFTGTGVEKVVINSLDIFNAGGYGILIKKCKVVKVNDNTLVNNGWDGTQLNTIVSKNISGLLGYDSSQSELQAFYAGIHASNGGAMKLVEVQFPEVIGNLAKNNLRGFKLEDCGINGAGFIMRNISTQNIDSGIYLGAGNTYFGCQNITVTVNSSTFNSNNGILCIGGTNNILSQNQISGNWSGAFYAHGTSNLTFRSSGLYNNSRSPYNGIGNQGDVLADIVINEAYNMLGTTISISDQSYKFIAEIIDCQVHQTGLGGDIYRRGFALAPAMGQLSDHDNNIIKVSKCSFIGQDYGIDLSEMADISNLRFVPSKNEFSNISESNIRQPQSGNYYEIPFSNHVTNIKEADFSVTNTGNILIKENGTHIVNPYFVNELRVVSKGSDLQVILKDSKKVQFDLPTSGASINGVMVNSVLNQAIVDLNNILSNTGGFSNGTGNPVVGFYLSGTDLTVELQDGTSYTVNSTTLGVHDDKFVSSVALNGSDLELTMNDSSVISINVSNMINGSTLPTRANDWYIAYGNNSGDEVLSAGVTSTYKNEQPFYNGNFLSRGERYIWTHDGSNDYMLGSYSGAESTIDYTDIFNSNNWLSSFKFDSTNSKVSEISSVGVDVSSRFSNGYGITNNTVQALHFGIDNYLYLLDVSDGSKTIIGKSNSPLVGSEVSIFFTGKNQPNAKFPVMVKQYANWSIVHDFDNSETSIVEGLETDTVLKSHISINPGEKFMVNLNFAGRNQRLGLGYSGSSDGVSNAHTTILDAIAYGMSENIIPNDSSWALNSSATSYDISGPNWSRGSGVNAGMVSFIYNSDNSMDLYSEDMGEIIATKSIDLDGSPVHLFFGVGEATTPGYIPSVSKQDINGGSQPIISHAPDISDQSFNVIEGTAFSYQIALDAGSDIVNQYVISNGVDFNFVMIDQSTGMLTGTAPAYSGTSDSYVFRCKAANAIGGIKTFNVTLTVEEYIYTNSKSLLFQDGISSYLGGNANAVTALERSSNGSGSSDAWTIMFWYKGSTANTGQTLFYFGASDVVNGGHIEIKQTNASGQKRLRLRFGSNGNHLQLTTPSGSIDPSKFQQVIVTYDGGTTGANSGSMSTYYSRFTIAIDGVIQSTNNTNNNFGWSNPIVGQNYRFGRFTSGNYPKDILLNQLAIWDSDQSSNITGLWNNGVSQDINLLSPGVGNMNTNYLAPVHYYEITDSVTLIEDLSGNVDLVGTNFVTSDLVSNAP